MNQENLISDNPEKLYVLYEGQGELAKFQNLAERLQIPLLNKLSDERQFPTESDIFFLSWRDGSLKLFDQQLLKKGGIMVDIEPRNGEQRSWPIARQGALAQALGRKTRTVVDATSGWGQDSLSMFRMGYEVLCIERSLLMAEMLQDGFNRLEQQNWMQKLELHAPGLLIGDAISLLASLETPPDCIYLDPMFPPKRKKSALAKKSMMMLRELIGDDTDSNQLFDAAFAATKKRVVVKSPDYMQALGGKPDESFQGKLLRYDVYLKNRNAQT